MAKHPDRLRIHPEVFLGRLHISGEITRKVVERLHIAGLRNQAGVRLQVRGHSPCIQMPRYPDSPFTHVHEKHPDTIRMCCTGVENIRMSYPEVFDTG